MWAFLSVFQLVIRDKSKEIATVGAHISLSESCIQISFLHHKTIVGLASSEIEKNTHGKGGHHKYYSDKRWYGHLRYDRWYDNAKH